MDFFVKGELMRNELLVCLRLPKHSFPEYAGFSSEVIAFIYFKLCVICI